MSQDAATAIPRSMSREDVRPKAKGRFTVATRLPMAGFFLAVRKDRALAVVARLLGTSQVIADSWSEEYLPD